MRLVMLPLLLQELSVLNLTKYMSEVSTALVVAKLKLNDIDAVLKLCTHLHRNYSHFAPTLFKSWQKVLMINPIGKLTEPSKMRVDLCFYSELLSVGIFTKKTGLPLLHACLLRLITRDKREHLYISVVLTFCKQYGTEFAGILPIRISELAKKYGVALPVSPLFTPNRQCGVRKLLYSYYRSLVKHLQSEYKCLQLAKESWRQPLSVHLESTAENQKLQMSYERLHASVRSLAIMLGLAMLLLEEQNKPASGRVLQNNILNPYRNNDTRSFYVDLPDLSQYLPDNDEDKRQRVRKVSDAMDFWDGDQHLGILFKSSSSEEIVHGVNVEDDEDIPNSIDNSDYFERFMLHLSNCGNREMIDNAAVDFLLNLNTKSTRKHLVKALCAVQCIRIDSLPMFARFVAIVNSISPNVGDQLCQMLKKDCKYHLRKKDQINIQTKLKLVRYIGELVNFGIYKKEDALNCLQHLQQNGKHDNVEIACALLDVCGVYLYNSHETRMQLDALLEQMMRLKQNTTMPDRHVQLVENVYCNIVKQPESLAVSKKTLPVMHSYIQHLIFKELNGSNVDQIVQRMRRLNWDNKETFAYAVHCLSQAYNVRFNLIASLANMLYVLMLYQEKAVVRVIDTVLEDIRMGMDTHDINLARRQVAMVKYLGELYTFRLVESDTFINTLYTIISFGVILQDHDGTCLSMLDPPGSLLRLKLALVLLNTSGKYFYAGSDRDRLDHFLAFFQQYYWYKKSHPYWSDASLRIGIETTMKDLNPILMDHMYRECLTSLRPNLKLHNSFEEANKAVDGLCQKFLVGSGALQQVKQQDIGLSNELKQENITEPDNEQQPENYDSGPKASIKILSESPSLQQDAEDLLFDVELERVLAESSHQQTLAKHNPKYVPEPTIQFDNIPTQEKMNITAFS
uniref:MIF4G domain-containing protein n=1 Tax=Anopheles maculatus TaxID=74869 RepID=A0A182T7Y2_9DIPT